MTSSVVPILIPGSKVERQKKELARAQIVTKVATDILLEIIPPAVESLSKKVGKPRANASEKNRVISELVRKIDGSLRAQHKSKNIDLTKEALMKPKIPLPLEAFCQAAAKLLCEAKEQAPIKFETIIDKIHRIEETKHSSVTRIRQAIVAALKSPTSVTADDLSQQIKNPIASFTSSARSTKFLLKALVNISIALELNPKFKDIKLGNELLFPRTHHPRTGITPIPYKDLGRKALA